MMKLYRVVAALECNYNEMYPHWRYTAMHGGSIAFEFYPISAPSPRGHARAFPKGCSFWFTEHGWKSLKIAALIREQHEPNIIYKVKTIKVPKSAIYWTDGIQAVITHMT